MYTHVRKGCPSLVVGLIARHRVVGYTPHSRLMEVHICFHAVHPLSFCQSLHGYVRF